LNGLHDGKTVSLDPSIGNWSFPCQSHYWIRNNRIKWAPKWSREQIERGRTHDNYAKEGYFGASDVSAEAPIKDDSAKVESGKTKKGLRVTGDCVRPRHTPFLIEPDLKNGNAVVVGVSAHEVGCHLDMGGVLEHL
jgi:hypothetical protein